MSLEPKVGWLFDVLHPGHELAQGGSGEAVTRRMPTPMSWSGGSDRQRFARTHADLRVDAQVEFTQHVHQTVDCEAAQVAAADARKIRRRDAGPGLSLAHRKSTRVQRLDDFGRQQSLELTRIGLRLAKVGKYMPLPRTSSSASSFITGYLLRR